MTLFTLPINWKIILGVNVIRTVQNLYEKLWRFSGKIDNCIWITGKINLAPQLNNKEIYKKKCHFQSMFHVASLISVHGRNK